MQTGQNEIRIIWFMLLIIISIGAWWLGVPMLSYICAVAAVVSVMFFVGRVQNSLEQVVDMAVGLAFGEEAADAAEREAV